MKTFYSFALVFAALLFAIPALADSLTTTVTASQAFNGGPADQVSLYTFTDTVTPVNNPNDSEQISGSFLFDLTAQVLPTITMTASGDVLTPVNLFANDQGGWNWDFNGVAGPYDLSFNVEGILLIPNFGIDGFAEGNNPFDNDPFGDYAGNYVSTSNVVGPLAVPAPEPGSLALLVIGLAFLLQYRNGSSRRAW